MQVKVESSYKRSLKKIQKKDKQLIPIIEDTLKLLLENKEDTKLKYKKMECKKNKNRYSIRIINKPFRILMNVSETSYNLVCVCDHDKYDHYNKNC